MKKTGGVWDPRGEPTYFLASNLHIIDIVKDLTSNSLAAINEIRTKADIDEIAGWIDGGMQILIDSGVYSLAAGHAQRHGLTVTEAIAMPPGDLDGFDALFDAYVRIVKRFQHQVWGYIEIDQGGRETKIKTRRKLERMGLRPIPVYHPFSDGWDYFDELARGYDRISMGNLVGADQATRKRLMATIWERRRNYPDLWIHFLGLTPNEKLLAYPVPSCDSSTWLSGARWGQHSAMVANRRVWTTGADLIYDLNGQTTTCNDGWRLGAYEGEMMRRTMACVAREQKATLGAVI